jgi:hypothetical protein
MGLYSSFNTSQYYDEPVKSKAVVDEKPVVSYKKPHSADYGLTEQKRKSLYAEAQHAASSRTEFGNIDFRDLYRVGQMIMVQNPNGVYRTKLGRIIEIVARDLMYVGMEDSHRDVNGAWLVDFVLPKDKITKI